MLFSHRTHKDVTLELWKIEGITSFSSSSSLKVKAEPRKSHTVLSCLTSAGSFTARIMTVSSFSRSHFSHCVSDFSKNPKPMSKRGQEQNVGEGSAVAKPKSLSPVQAKTRPTFLVSQASHDSSRWCVGRDTNTALSNPESPERAMTMQTGATQSFRQRTATESDTTDNVRHSQVKNTGKCPEP